MNCSICGKTVNENDTFCLNCGSPLTLKQRAFSTLPQTKKIRMLKVSDYLLMLFISTIPIVNVIFFLTWIISPNVNINKKNYAIAALILTAIAIVLLTSIFVLYLF